MRAHLPSQRAAAALSGPGRGWPGPPGLGPSCAAMGLVATGGWEDGARSALNPRALPSGAGRSV